MRVRVKIVTLSFKLNRPFCAAVMVAGLLSCVAVQLGSETLTITTTYPSPSGIYRSLITTGGGGAGPAVDTVLNRNAGNVILATGANGKVGIQMNNPQYALDVNGSINIQGASGPFTATIASTLFNVANMAQCPAGQVLSKTSPTNITCVPGGAPNVQIVSGASWGWRWANHETCCPAGFKVVGGGGLCQSFAGWNFIYASYPTNNSCWRVNCDTPLHQWNLATTYAVCAQ